MQENFFVFDRRCPRNRIFLLMSRDRFPAIAEQLYFRHFRRQQTDTLGYIFDVYATAAMPHARTRHTGLGP